MGVIPKKQKQKKCKSKRGEGHELEKSEKPEYNVLFNKQNKSSEFNKNK